MGRVLLQAGVQISPMPASWMKKSDGCKCTLLTCLPQKLQVSVAVATLLPIHVDRRSEYKNLLLTQWMFSFTKAVEKGPRCPSDA